MAMRKCAAPASRARSIACTTMPLGAALSAATMTLLSGPGSICCSVGASVSSVTGVSFSTMSPARVTVSVTGCCACSGCALPRGRSTASECKFCSDSDASMNVASRKNMTSIIGMISMRPLRRARDLRNFMAAPPLVETDVIDEAGAEPLHLVHDLGLALREVVEGEERDEGDEEAERGGDERLGDAAGDAPGIDQALIAEQLEGADHAGDSAEQSQQRRGGDDGLEHPQPASQGLLDEARLGGRARFHPPRRPHAGIEDARAEAGKVGAAGEDAHTARAPCPP